MVAMTTLIVSTATFLVHEALLLYAEYFLSNISVPLLGRRKFRSSHNKQRLKATTSCSQI
ncbi:hypothetical protein IFVP177_C1320028 [Vibrio parahaemolyticus]